LGSAGETGVGAQLKVGCSGWSYDDWKGIFYSPSVRSMLQEYTKIFPTAEINASFYRMPDKGVVQGWARYTPEGFELAAKVPQSITHNKKLKGAAEDLAAFVEMMAPVKEAGKLGPLLLQLPSSLRFDARVLKDLFAALPKGYDFAIEPREASWMAPEAIKTMRDANVCLVAVDEPLLPPVIHVTADFLYVRWHGHGKQPWYNYQYSKEQLEPWVPRIRKAAEEVSRGYGFFNNHYHGFAPKNALEMTAMLSQLTPAQQEMFNKLERTVGAKTAAKETLDAFVSKGGVAGTEIEMLVTRLSDSGRIDRAKEIASSDLALSKVSPHYVRADVHGTRVLLDLTEQQVRHNCIDYLKGIPEKRICKHIVRLLLELPPEIAREFADDLGKSKAQWTFERYWGSDTE
jgi:uncharacterized protein YecE (DUF72 family)